MTAEEGVAMDVDLNCDLGEGCPHDADLMPLITSANVACGGHAGDLATALDTLFLAKKHGVQVGAHPGFLDRASFGRREIALPEERVYLECQAQVTALAELALIPDCGPRYLKPHGALYNMACRDEAMARPVVRVAEEHDLAVMGLPGSALASVAEGRVPFLPEGFADRRYLPDGSLVPRSRPDAFVEDVGEAVRQALWLVRERGVKTLCVHGDNPRAVAFVVALREGLTREGCTIRPFGV
jgi:5-oxoprolinase (ATP-hydrolysing) subunit A